VLAEYMLPTVGQGAQQLPHPDGVHMLLDVGEGQDGVYLFHGRLDGEAISVFEYPWADRCLVDVSPDGTEFMTVGHALEDVVLHSFPDGTELCGFAVDRFPEGAGVGDPHLGWNGGYLDAATAVITVAGQTEDEEWSVPYVVDLPSGAIRGRLAADPVLRLRRHLDHRGRRQPYDALGARLRRSHKTAWELDCGAPTKQTHRHIP
jgi:hypothetical protein